FLTNPEDEEYLISDKGQGQIAEAIFNAFKEYKLSMESEPETASTPILSKTVEETPVSPPKQAEPHQTTAKAPEKTPAETVKPVTSDKVVFKIQIVSSIKKLPENSANFRGVHDVSYYFHQGIYKYTVGEFKTLQEAIGIQLVMQKKGFKDAFVVAFFKGERISVEDAKQIQGN
ncbi:MAG: hypothetical protein NTU44_01615, partial [Bacteroidetes bacterium]|nr:hypothetical protein [Bacteroidota bacterium]